jgi:hypothetical protein
VSGLAGRVSAQARADRVRAFRDELARLEREGVITLDPGQRERLARHHDSLLADLAARFDVDTTDAARRMSWGMRIASFLGAAALCASVWLLFYRVWGLLPTAAHVLLPLAGTIGLLALSELFARRESSGYLAGLASLIAIACFVLDLTVLGSVFNMTPSENAFLCWGLLAVTIAYTWSLRIPLAAGLLMLMAFSVAKAGALRGLIWYDPLWRYPESALLAGIAVFALPLAFVHRERVTFPAVYRLTGGIVAFSSILVLGFWGEGSWLRNLGPDGIEEIYQVLGLLLAATAIGVGLWRRWNEVVNLGGVAFFVFLWVKFFDWWWDWLPKWAFFLLFGLAALGSLVVIKALRRRAERVGA